MCEAALVDGKSGKGSYLIPEEGGMRAGRVPCGKSARVLDVKF